MPQFQEYYIERSIVLYSIIIKIYEQTIDLTCTKSLYLYNGTIIKSYVQPEGSPWGKWAVNDFVIYLSKHIF